MKLDHQFLQGEINLEKAKERFSAHRDSVFGTLPMLDKTRRSKVARKLAELAERLTLSDKRSRTKRPSGVRERDYIRDIRALAGSLVNKIQDADPAIKERLYRSLAKSHDATLDESELLVVGRKQYVLAIKLIQEIRVYARKPKAASGPKRSPLQEVVRVLGKIWTTETGQSITNTTKTPSDGFPLFVAAFMKAANSIATSKGRIIWQPKRRLENGSNELRRYDEATAIRNAIEALRRDGA